MTGPMAPSLGRYRLVLTPPGGKTPPSHSFYSETGDSLIKRLAPVVKYYSSLGYTIDIQEAE